MSNVKAIPDGYSTVTPFLNVNGAAEAIEFYKAAFGAKERARIPGPNNLIMHAEISIGNSIVMMSDAFMSPPTQSTCHLYVEDADSLWAQAIQAGAQVVHPIGDMFWGDRYGVVADKWGNRWAIATHKEDPTPEEMRERMAEAMKQMPQA